MYVVIAGGGVVGGYLARELLANRHDVVVIEREKSVCEKIAARVGALAIHGLATNIEVLEEAGIEKADVAVGAMPHDGDNLAFAILARNFEIPRIIARMRNPRYRTAYRLAGVTHAIHIADLFVSQLVLQIEQPSLRPVASLGGGKGTMVVATLPQGALVDGKTVQEIGGDGEFPADCVIAGIYRESTEEFIIPRGPIVLAAEDQVFLAASAAAIRKATKFLQRTR